MFRFAHIYYFYLLLAIPFLTGLFVLFMIWRKKALSRFGERKIIDQLMPEFSNTRLVLKFIVMMLAIASLIFALAGPQTGSKLEKIQRKGIDLVIALDVSNSMLAQDIKPDRLERAKQSISRLIDNLDGDRIGLVIFAGKAYMQLPITSDYAAAKLFLSTINTGIVQVQGTDIAAAIEMASTSFGETKHNKAIVIITDGEDHEGEVYEQAEAIAAKGINIYAIGMGSPEGAPIPIFSGNVQTGYKKDNEGNTIISRLDEAMLQRIATIGKGTYVRASTTETGLQKIFDDINKIQKTEIESKLYSDYEDRFYYFVFLALFFILLELFIFDRKNQLYSRFKPFEV
jgi:Ca-activated chloride channel family protein